VTRSGNSRVRALSPEQSGAKSQLFKKRRKTLWIT